MCIIRFRERIGQSTVRWQVMALLTSVMLVTFGCGRPAPKKVADVGKTQDKQSEKDKQPGQPVQDKQEAQQSEADQQKAEADEGEAKKPDDDAQEPAPKTSGPADLALGRKLYLQNCTACHGDKGDGQGVVARFVYPRPRNFGGGNFRLVSNEERVPTAEDLEAVIVRGMPGSAMPPWPKLTAPQRQALVAEVQRLFKAGAREQFIARYREEEGLDSDEPLDIDDDEINAFVTRRTAAGQAIPVPEIGKGDAAAVARGKEIYVKQSCHSCHGLDGKGGEGIQKQVNMDGTPTRPRDLTRGLYKGGPDVASVFRRISLGMPGSPMPASSATLGTQDMVDLAHFVLSLSDEATRNQTVLNRTQITAHRVAKLTDGADDDLWKAISPVALRTTPLWWRDDSQIGLTVQAAHDGKSIGVRLVWKDLQDDRHAARSESFEDAAAVQWFRGESEPFLGMGAAGSPLDLWMWDADREGKSADVDTVNPRLVVDSYPFSEKGVGTAEYDRPGTKLENQPDVSLPSRRSGNQITPSSDSGSGGSSLSSAGPGSVTFRLKPNQQVVAHSTYHDGQWSVVLLRPLSVGEAAQGLSLKPGEAVSVAFAIWDGSHHDRNGQKMISIWQDLILEP